MTIVIKIYVLTFENTEGTSELRIATAAQVNSWNFIIYMWLVLAATI